MKKIIALTLCFLSILQLKAQDSFNCDSLIKKHYKISDLKDNSHFLEEVKAVILCKYDSLDMHILMGPNGDLPFTVLTPLAIARIGTSNEDKVFMSEIIQTLSSIREMPHYEELRHKVAISMQIKKTGISDQLYQNLPAKESKNQRTPGNGDKQQIVESVYGFTDYTEGLSKAKESGKPVLLYFSAHASIPARKFDDQVLRDSKIQEILNNQYEVIFLSVDDHTPLTENKIYYAKSLKRDVKYLGDIYLDLQLDKFQSEVQPMFFILDKTGKKIASSVGVGVNEFLEFLSKENNSNRH